MENQAFMMVVAHLHRSDPIQSVFAHATNTNATIRDGTLGGAQDQVFGRGARA